MPSAGGGARANGLPARVQQAVGGLAAFGTADAQRGLTAGAQTVQGDDRPVGVRRFGEARGLDVDDGARPAGRADAIVLGGGGIDRGSDALPCPAGRAGRLGIPVRVLNIYQPVVRFQLR